MFQSDDGRASSAAASTNHRATKLTSLSALENAATVSSSSSSAAISVHLDRFVYGRAYAFFVAFVIFKVWLDLIVQTQTAISLTLLAVIGIFIGQTTAGADSRSERARRQRKIGARTRAPNADNGTPDKARNEAREAEQEEGGGAGRARKGSISELNMRRQNAELAERLLSSSVSLPNKPLTSPSASTTASSASTGYNSDSVVAASLIATTGVAPTVVCCVDVDMDVDNDDDDDNHRFNDESHYDDDDDDYDQNHRSDKHTSRRRELVELSSTSPIAQSATPRLGSRGRAACADRCPSEPYYSTPSAAFIVGGAETHCNRTSRRQERRCTCRNRRPATTTAAADDVDETPLSEQRRRRRRHSCGDSQTGAEVANRDEQKKKKDGHEDVDADSDHSEDDDDDADADKRNHFSLAAAQTNPPTPTLDENALPITY